jgi:hypothetical protein
LFTTAAQSLIVVKKVRHQHPVRNFVDKWRVDVAKECQPCVA